MIKPPTCSICGEKQVPLECPTERQSLPVFVCEQKVGKAKMPCDGWAVEVAKLGRHELPGSEPEPE